MWPHPFASTFTANSGDAVRRNATVMPLYTLTLTFIFLAGFTAVTVVPGLPDGDLSMLTLVRKSFPPWFLGVIGGAGALTVVVPPPLPVLGGGRVAGDGARLDSGADGSYAIRQESVAAHVRARLVRRSGAEAGARDGR